MNADRITNFNFSKNSSRTLNTFSITVAKLKKSDSSLYTWHDILTYLF